MNQHFSLQIKDPKSLNAIRSTNVSRHLCFSVHGELFTTPQSWKQHKYPSTTDCVKKRWFISQWNKKEQNVYMYYKKNGFQKVALGKLRMSKDLYCYKNAWDDQLKRRPWRLSQYQLVHCFWACRKAAQYGGSSWQMKMLSTGKSGSKNDRWADECLRSPSRTWPQWHNFLQLGPTPSGCFCLPVVPCWILSY